MYQLILKGNVCRLGFWRTIAQISSTKGSLKRSKQEMAASTTLQRDPRSLALGGVGLLRFLAVLSFLILVTL